MADQNKEQDRMRQGGNQPGQGGNQPGQPGNSEDWDTGQRQTGSGTTSPGASSMGSMGQTSDYGQSGNIGQTGDTEAGMTGGAGEGADEHADAHAAGQGREGTSAHDERDGVDNEALAGEVEH